MLCAEVSIYPLKAPDSSTMIQNSLETLERQGLDFSVGSISTHLHGSEEQVWRGLKEMFDQAQRQGEVSMVVTITNAADRAST
jgi:uncharacterized protein YqgV (UPF0045/DUF77 family)